MRKLFTAVVATDPPDQLLGRQLPLRLDHRTLAVHPVWFDPIQPRTLGRQLTSDDPHAALKPGSPVMRPDPLAHLVRAVPTGIVPNQQQRTLAFRRQSFADPFKKLGRHTRDGSPRDKPQPDFLGVGAQQPITGERLRVGVCFLSHQLFQSQPITFRPTVQLRLSQTRPPDLISKPQHPFGMLRGQANQPVARLFLRAYSGSGLVIQSRARFHRTPILRRASRMVSSLTTAFVSPCSKQTSATRFNVHSERSRPNWRGDWCKRPRNFSRFASSSSGLRFLGAEDFCSKQARPSRSKARMTLRAVWSTQPKCRAICRGVFPSALTSRIWQRRKLKAFVERKPARKVARSSSVKERMKIGSFILPIFAHGPAIPKGRLVLH